MGLVLIGSLVVAVVLVLIWFFLGPLAYHVFVFEGEDAREECPPMDMIDDRGAPWHKR